MGGGRLVSVWAEIDAMKAKHDQRFAEVQNEVEAAGAVKGSLRTDEYGWWRCRYVAVGGRHQEELTATKPEDLVARMKAIQERKAAGK